MNLVKVLSRPFQLAADNRWMDDRYFKQYVDLRVTQTGKQYQLEDLLRNATVWKCCLVRGQSIANLPRKVYKLGEDDVRSEVKRTDPRQKLMRRPNPELTKFDLDMFLTFQKLFYGTAFAQQIRDDNFRVLQHWPLQSNQMEVARDKDNLLVWKYRKPDGGVRIFAPWELHIRRGPTLDGVLGLSVFDLAFNSFAVGMALEEYCARVFENDSTPRGLLVTRNKLDTDAKRVIREQWEAKYGGLENRGKIGILDNELDFKPIGMTNDVAQFLESRKFQREEVAQWFNVPQHMAGILDRSTNNNIEQQSQEFIRDTLGPDLEALEQELERDVLWEKEQDSMFIEHRVENMMRGDFPGQSAYMKDELLNGIRSLNEVRRWKNLNPVEGGDEHWKPLNLGVVGQEDPQETPAEDAQDAQDQPKNKQKNDSKAQNNDQKRAEIASFAPIIEDSWKRIVNREVLALDKELKRAQSADEVVKWFSGFKNGHLEHIEVVLQPVLETFGAVNGVLRRDQNRALNTLVKCSEIRIKDFCSADLLTMRAIKDGWSNDKAKEFAQLTIELLEGIGNE